MLVFVVTQTLRRSSQLETVAKVIHRLWRGRGRPLPYCRALAPNGKLYWSLVSRTGWRDLRTLRKSQSLCRPDGDAHALPVGAGRKPLHQMEIARYWWRESPLSWRRASFSPVRVEVCWRFGAQMVVLTVLLDSQATGRMEATAHAGRVSGAGHRISGVAGRQRTYSAPGQHSYRGPARKSAEGCVSASIATACACWSKSRCSDGDSVRFRLFIPEFRSFYTTFFVNQAHNDYLQMLVETGLAGVSVSRSGFWCWSFEGLRPNSRIGPKPTNGAMTVAALLGCVGILVHSFFDFNLQIPANAALFYVLCAIGSLASLARIPEKAHSPATQSYRGTKPRAPAIGSKGNLREQVRSIGDCVRNIKATEPLIASAAPTSSNPPLKVVRWTFAPHR